MTIKIDHGAQVNTIPLSKYHALFPNKLNKSRYPKPNALLPTAHTWISHAGSPKPFLGHFVAEVMHARECRLYLTHFYMFEDLLSYAILGRLGIIAFNVPDLAATSQVDNIAVSTSPSQGNMRKTAKCVTFQNPIMESSQPPCSTPTHTSHGSKRKTAFPKVSIITSTHIKASKCKSTLHHLLHVPLSTPLYTAFALPPRPSHLR